MSEPSLFWTNGLWRKWLKEPRAMEEAVKTIMSKELHNIHWSRLAPEHQLAQVIIAYWSLVKESGKTGEQALAIVSSSAGRLYNSDAINALLEICKRPEANETDTGEHSLEKWHAEMERFEREHPGHQAIMWFLLWISSFFTLGWLGVEVSKLVISHIGFSEFYFLFLIFYGVARIAELFYLQKCRKKGTVHYKWTIYPITASHVIVVAVAVIEHIIFHWPNLFPVSLFGYLLFIGSTNLRWWTVSTLSEYESMHIEIREPHPLIKTGPYRYFRHPRYLANIVEVISIPLIGNAWIACICAVIMYVPATWIRARIEEDVMRKTLGAYL